jgi:hypothetical protein
MIIGLSVPAMCAVILISAVLALGLAGLAAWIQRGSVVNPIEDAGSDQDLEGPTGAVPLGRRAPRGSKFSRLCVDAQHHTARTSALTRRAAIARDAATAAWDNCALAEQAREMAWQAYEDALRSFDAARRKALGTRRGVETGRTAGGGPAAGLTDDDGEIARQVHRAALAAYRRGELTAEQLRRVFHIAGGTDPAQRERGQETALSGWDCRRARQVYEHAAAMEHAMRQVAWVAEVAARALAEEVARAAADAHQARSVVDQRVRSSRPRRRPELRQGAPSVA